MIKIFRHDGKSYEGNFINIPGKENYGHFMVGGKLLYSQNEQGQQGKATIFSVGSGDEVVITDDNFLHGFFNLQGSTGSIRAKIIEKEKTAPKKVEPPSNELSEKAKAVVVAIKKYAHGDHFWVKDIIGYSNVLYGYIDILIRKGIIARTDEKDPVKGAKFKLLK